MLARPSLELTNIGWLHGFRGRLLTIILQNCAEYTCSLIVSQKWLKSARLSRIIVLLFNKLITNHSLIAEKLETIFILPSFYLTHKMTYIAGYLLTTDGEYSVHHDHIWAVLQCVENKLSYLQVAKAVLL